MLLMWSVYGTDLVSLLLESGHEVAEAILAGLPHGIHRVTALHLAQVRGQVLLVSTQPVHISRHKVLHQEKLVLYTQQTKPHEVVFRTLLLFSYHDLMEV